ncbi:MAG: DUF4214 domain-containing protein, partial [Thermodesulfobacteria bacterium]|nr:DUF4214 domain-containing protein [Thermodesulfobacteriota bacterium]
IQALKNYIKKIAKIKKKGAIGQNIDGLKVKKVIALVTLEPKEGSFLYPGSIETTVVIERKPDFVGMASGNNSAGYYWDVTFNAGLNKVYQESGCKFTLNSLLVKFKWYPGNSTGGTTWKQRLENIAQKMIIGGSATLAIGNKSYTGFFLYQKNQLLFMANYSSSSGVIRNAQVFAQIPLKKGNPWTVMLAGKISGKDLAEELGISEDILNGNLEFNGWVDNQGLGISLKTLPFDLSAILPDWIHVKNVRNVTFRKAFNGSYSLEAEIDISMEHFVDKEFTVGLVVKKGEGITLYGKGIGPFDIGKMGEFEVNEIKISKENGAWEAGGTISYTLPEKWRDTLSQVGIELPEKVTLSYTQSSAGFIATGSLNPAPSINIPCLNLELEISSISLTNTSPWKFSLKGGIVHGNNQLTGTFKLDKGNIVFDLDPDLSFSFDLPGGVNLEISNFEVTLGSNFSLGGKVTVNIPPSNVMHVFLGDQFSAYLKGSKGGFTISTFTNIPPITQDLGPLGSATFSINKVSISSNGSISGEGYISFAGVSATFTIGTQGSKVYFIADFGDQGVGIDLGSIFTAEIYNKFEISTIGSFQTIQIDGAKLALGIGNEEGVGLSLNGTKIVYILPTSIPPWGFAFFDDFNGNVHIAGFAVNVGIKFPAPSTQDAMTVFNLIKDVFTGGKIDWDKLASLNSPSLTLHDIYIAFPQVLKKVFGGNKLVLIKNLTFKPKTFVEIATADNPFKVIDAIVPADKRHGSININLLGFKAGASYELKSDQPEYETHMVPDIDKFNKFLEKATYVDKNCGDTPQSLLASGEGIKLVFLSYASDSNFQHKLGHAEGSENDFQKSLKEAIKDFYYSAEYRDLMKNISAKDYIRSLFKVVLNREPTDKELKKWLKKYNEKISQIPNKILGTLWEQKVRAEVIPNEFFVTSEAQEALNSIQPTDEEINEFVTRLYKDILNREPDFGGFYNWKKFVTPGRAWVVNAGETGHGWAIVYGPYISLPPGTYAATFEIKVADNTLNGEAIGIDVSAESGRKVLASRKILYRDFRFPNQYQKFTLVFTLKKNEDNIETRVWRINTPKCKIYIRRIKLVSGLKKETHTIALPDRLGGGEAKVTWELKDITDQLESLQHLLRDLSPFSNTGANDYLKVVWNRLKSLSGGNVKFDYNEEDKCAEAVFPYDAQTVVKIQFYEYDKQYDMTGLKLKGDKLYSRFGKVILYVDEDFKGTSSVVTDDVSHCSNIAVGNDRVSSVKIEGRGKAVLYQHANYRGNKLTIEKSKKSLADTAIGNDQLSSVKVFFPIDFKKVSRWRIKVLSYDPSEKEVPLFVTVIDSGAVQTVFYNADGSKTVLLGLVPNGPVFKAMKEVKEKLANLNPYPEISTNPDSYLENLWNTYFQPYMRASGNDKPEVNGTVSIRRKNYSLTLLDYDNGKPVTGLKIENGRLKAKTGRVILYKDANFKGDSLPVNFDISDLSEYGFANVASSIKLEKATGAILYPDIDYKPLKAEKVFFYVFPLPFREYIKLYDGDSKMCLTTSPPDETGIQSDQLYFGACRWNDKQAFYLVPYGKDVYALKSVKDGGCVDVY